MDNARTLPFDRAVLSATVVALASVALPAAAAVTYSFRGGLNDGSTSASFEFVVTTSQFITAFAQPSPAAASCAVTSPTFESCSIAGDISFSPRSIGVDPGIAFSALLKPIGSDFAVSRNFGATFGVPPGAQVFGMPGLYTATSLLNLSAAALQVSGFPEPMSAPIPEPSTWVLLIGGLGATGAATRSRLQGRANALRRQ